MKIPNLAEQEKWDRALTLLKRFVPRASDFIPENIAGWIGEQGGELDWVQIQTFGRDDHVVWEEICRRIPALADEAEVMLVCDACYSNQMGPLRATWVELRADLPDIGAAFDRDQVFGGDVVLLTSAVLVLVHHEGLLSIYSNEK